MNTKEIKDKYYDLAKRDANYKQYPLWSTLVAADEHIAAAAYLSGWRDVTGKSLRYFRDSGKR